MKKSVILLFVILLQQSIFAQSNSYPFEVKIIGSGDPIIMIPGLASSGDVWDKTVESQKESHQCHVLTLAGFAGFEPITLERGFLPVIEEQIIAYIKTELESKPIIIGHSLGGFLAMKIASSEPGIAQKIVIVDSYPFYSAAMIPTATEATSKPQAEMMKNMLLAATDSSFAQQQKMTLKTMVADPENIKTAVKWSIDSDRATMAQAMYEIMTTDLREEVGSIKCPILVFGSWYAAKDYGITQEMVQRTYEAQFQQAENCTVKVAATARHFVMWDEPKWFQEQLVKFLE